MSTDLVIAKLDSARLALFEATTISEAKRFVDIGVTAETWAKQQKLGDEITAYAHSFTIDALAQLGRMLKATPRNVGQKRRGTKMEPRDDKPTLADLGLDKKTSSVAQKVADLPPEQLAQVKAGTTSLAKATQSARQPKAAQAPKPKEPTPEDEESELADALAQADKEIRSLQALVESLKKSDLAAEVVMLKENFDKLEGRLQQCLATKAEAEKQARYSTGLLAKIRKALKVEKNAEILPALERR